MSHFKLTTKSGWKASAPTAPPPPPIHKWTYVISSHNEVSIVNINEAYMKFE